jgi:hypothetical protein
MNLQFEELSRKAASGSLTAAEQEWLDAFLRAHPARRADVDWDAALSAKLDEKIAAMPALPGWERTERALRAEAGERSVTHGAPARARSGPGVLDRLADWFASSLGLAINAQAVAVALLLAQAGAIGLLAWQYEAAQEEAIRAGTQDPTPRGPLLRVSFRPDLREAELRRVLADVGGEIVGGPGQIGVYVVRVKDGSLTAAAQRLRDSGTTELVEIVETKR